MGTSFRWSDGDWADGVTAWIPAFAGMTITRIGTGSSIGWNDDGIKA